MKPALTARSATRGASARTGKSVSSKSSKDATDAETFHCAPCKIDGTIIEATNFCMDCGENLCEQCVNTHKKFPAMKNHQILGKSARKSENDTVVTVNPLECPDHPGRTVDMYCGEHNEIWCGACIAVNHRNCTSTRVIAEAAKGVEESEEYKEMKIRITAAKAEVEALKKQAAHKVNDMSKEKEKAASRIKAFRKKVDNILDQMQKDTETELEAEYGRCLQQLELDLKVYNNVLNSFEAFNSMLQVRKNDPPKKPSIIFVGIQRAKQKLKFVNELVQLTKLTELTSDFEFYPYGQVISWLNSLKLLGVFCHKQRPYKSCSFQTYDVSHPSDKRSCDIYGSCLLDNGNILLADWDNSKVKRLDEEYNITDYCEVPGNPASVCSINPEQAVVTLTPQHMLQFIRLDKTMTLTRQLSIGESCRGVACSNGYIYVLCGGFKNENVGTIKIYNISGALVKVVENNNSNQGIFSCPVSITVTQDGKLCHIADGRRGIITVTQRNDVVSVMSKKSTSWPCGICLDSHGNILTCCNKSQTITQQFGMLSMDTILTYGDGIRRPSSICFDRKQLKLIVTSNMCNVIRVFQLQTGPLTGIPPDPVEKVEGKTKKKPKPTRVKAASVPLKAELDQEKASTKTSKPANNDAKQALNPRPKSEIIPKGKTPAIPSSSKSQHEENMKPVVGKGKQKTSDKENIKEANKNKEKFETAIGEIANDITKMLTSDNAEKSAADFKVTLQKILETNAAMKKA